MKPSLTVNQACAWAMQLSRETKEHRNIKNDNFDAMMYIESKEVRKVLPKIIEGLASYYDDANEYKRQFEIGIQELSKTAFETYGKTDNPISQGVKDFGNEEIIAALEKFTDLIERFQKKPKNENAEPEMHP